MKHNFNLYNIVVVNMVLSKYLFRSTNYNTGLIIKTPGFMQFVNIMPNRQIIQ